MAVRGIFASKFYGWCEAVPFAPRAVLTNIIAIMAARRAMLHYIRISLGSMPVWEKTPHHFPEKFAPQEGDSKRLVYGKSGSVRVEHGGVRIIHERLEIDSNYTKN